MSQPRSFFTPIQRTLGLGTVVVLTAAALTYIYVERRGGRDAVVAAAKPFRTVQTKQVPVPRDGGTWTGPVGAAWPAAGTAEISLTGSSARGKAGGLPVALSAKAGKQAPKKVRVSALSRAHSEALGVSGPVITIAGDQGEVDAAVDYTGFAQLYGGGWASRLTLVELPSCAATDPERSQCQATKPVKVEKRADRPTVSTSVVTGGSARVFAVTGETQSVEGNYKASDLQASGSWTSGDSSGAFTYTNPVRLPATSGAVPEVSLSYSSQAVDGKMAGSNSQASGAGDGWDYSRAFVERTYAGCADDQDKVDGKDPNNKGDDKKTADQCWKSDSPNISVSLGGANASLVKDQTTGVWRAQQDGNWRIELEGAAATKDAVTSERWVITTPDGTRNYFASEVGTSNSRWTAPVFGNHAGEKCYAAAFKDSSCAQAWRWLLDKVIDVHGNVTRYYYSSETGHYGAAGDKDKRVEYIRGGHLDRIEYGLHVNSPNVPATARVLFAMADRCFEAECFKDGKPVKANWPDVPWDKECDTAPCTDKLAPVFFSTKRLTKITTQIWRAAAFADVESWTLNQEFKSPKEQKSASLWLKEIVHAGHVGGTVTDPPVQFTGVELANRANAVAGGTMFSRWRIQNIRTESGADIHVKYSDPDCDTFDLPRPEANNRLCYPVYWTPDGIAEPQLDWFRKYRVLETNQYDRTANQPSISTRYNYSTDGGGADVLWAWDDGEFTQQKYRTYGQWRGYARVTAIVGAPDSTTQLRTRKQFYRGLNEDPLPNGATRSVQVTDSSGQSYADHPALAGSPLEEVTLDGDAVVNAKSTAYWVRKTASRTRTGGSDKAYLSGPNIEKTRRLLAPGAWQRTELRTEYNDEGKPISVSDLGDVDKSGDEKCKRISYLANDSAWLRGFVSREEAVAKACDQTPSRPADVLSDTKTFYDGSDTEGAGLSKGDVTRRDTLDRWQGGPVYTTTARASYDELGREVSKTDATGKVTKTDYTPAGPGPVTQTRTKNPLNHEGVTDQDPAFAQPTTIKDANGKLTVLKYDPMGRLAKVWLPGRAATNSANMEFAYRVRADGPLAVTTKRLGPSGGYLTEVGLFDSLYRSVQTQRSALGGTRLVESTGYNDKGQKAYASASNHATGAPSDQLLEVTPGADRSRTVSTYDAVGRTIDDSLWSYNRRLWGTTTSYGGSAAGWQTSVTPPSGGTPTATISNVDGKTVELRQFRSAAPDGAFDATTYTYTPRGDVSTVTNAAGRVWKYEYDLRGREVTTRDPDKGVTTLVYDNADKVVSSKDAAGNVVSTEYDDLGRQAKRLFNTTVAATWTYDTVAKGHLTKSTSYVDGYAFSRQVFLYNDAYQVQDEESVIPAMPGLTKLAGKFVTTRAYNVDGSVKYIKQPKVGPMSSELLSRAYDEVGNLARLTGTTSSTGAVRVYVDGTKYSPYGEVLKRTLGQNDQPQTYQNYVYDDATRRLTAFYFDRDASVPNVVALKYRYDDAGNVLSMANQPLDKDEQVRPGKQDVQCFGYDYLRRLTGAWSQTQADCASTPSTAVVGGVAPYWKSYEFDSSGSRKSVTDHVTGTTSDYAYRDAADAAQPHAVRNVTTGTKVDHYDWDAVGNLSYRKVGDVSETYTWSPHGKLTKISGPNGDTKMVYDVDGNRVARIDPDGSATAFVAGHEYTTSSQGLSATRYYEHAGDVIASRTDTASGPGDVIWLGSDQHDSATWAVNSVTRVETVKYSDPYGGKRAPTQGPAWPSGQKGFVGGVEDPNGLTLLGARYYDPKLGSFISVDPKIDEYDPQRMHAYSYANNNPVTFADPDGLFWGAIKNAAAKAGNAVAKATTSAAKWVVKNSGTIADVAGTIAMVAAVLPPPAQIVAAVAGAVALVAGAIDTANKCVGGDAMGCAMGAAGMLPGVRQAKGAARGVRAIDEAAEEVGERAAKRVARDAEEEVGERAAKQADGAPGCNSFLPGTAVLMADRRSYKPIEEVAVDDEVWATDPETGEEGARPVTRLITGNGDKKFVEVTTDQDGDGAGDGAVTATDGHPFWVDDQREWLRADQLKPGQHLLTPDGARVTVIAIVAYGAVATVHNLTVDDIHTYYVRLGDADILVHNVGSTQDSCPVWQIDESRHPESARHAADSGGEGLQLTIDRGGAAARRRESLRGHPTQPGMDRDEFPPAMFREGGCGASVRCIPSSDNRGAGSSMGHQLSNYPDGTVIVVRTGRGRHAI